jgi:hypothetical protein
LRALPLVLVAAVVLLASAASAAASSGGVAAALTLVVRADQSNAAPVETALRVVAPSNDKDVRRLLTNAPSSPAYGAALASLLDRLGVYQARALVLRLALAIDRPPQVSVSGGRASVFFSGVRDLGDYIASAVPGVWDVERHGTRLRLCVARARAVPARTTWRVELYVVGARVIAAQPMPHDFRQVVAVPSLGNAQTASAPPTAGEGNVAYLAWLLRSAGLESSGLTCRGIAAYGLSAAHHPLVAEIRLPRSTRALLDAFAGGWAHIRLALSYLATTLVFVPLALLALAVGRSSSLVPLRRRIALAVAAWLALLGGGAATWLLAGGSNDVTVTERRPALIAAAVAALLAAAAVSRRWLLVAAGPVAALTVLSYIAQSRVAPHAYLDGGWGMIALAAASALLVAVMSLLALTVLTGLVPGRHAGVITVAVLLIAGLLVAQAAGGGYAHWHDRHEATMALNAGLFTQPKAWVVGYLADFAFPFVGFVTDMLPALALALIVALLRLLSRNAATPFLGIGAESVPALAGIVFAAYVVGTQGLVYGWKAPLAFVIASVLALALWRLIRRPRLLRITDDAAQLNDVSDGGALLVGARAELLARAVELVELRQRLATLDEADANRRRELDERIRELEVGGSQESPTRLPEHSSPGPIAVGLGPGETWWDNARIAVRWGALLALAPIVFFLYVLVTKRLAHDLSPWRTLGIADVLRGSLYEVLFWLAAALVLGLLFPYLPTAWGAVKGGAIAAGYAAAVGLSVWILPGTIDGWAFRTFELFLFLVALGVVLDWQTIRKGGAPVRLLADLYRLGDVRYVGSYTSAALGSVVLIAQQLESGQGQAAITQIIKSIPVLIPPALPH